MHIVIAISLPSLATVAIIVALKNPLLRVVSGQSEAEVIDLQAVLDRDAEFIRAVAMRSVVQAALEAEMTEGLGPEKGERTEGGLGYRSGYYSRALITLVGTLELRVPQDRGGLDRTVRSL